MARRIVEEDVSSPSTTVVEGDGSWVGRTIVALVVIALLVLGAVWLFNNVGDGDGGGGDAPIVENNEGDTNVDVENPVDGEAPAPDQS